MKTFFLTLFLLSHASFCIANNAENQYSQKFDNFTVDYSIFPSTFLSADIAASYGLKRSKYENLINVFVSKAGEKGGVKVDISGQVKNLLGQQQILPFKEIAEDNTVYYLAPIKVRGEEYVHFEITCTVAESGEVFVVKFSRKLYQDN